MRQFWLLVVLLSTAVPLGAKEVRCVLPPPDGSDIEWSPPSITGRLEKVRAGNVVIRTATHKSYVVSFSSTTELFTAYGGGVESGQLKAGQYASIWLTQCRPPGKNRNRAAVLQICSLSPEPCPE